LSPQILPAVDFPYGLLALTPFDFRASAESIMNEVTNAADKRTVTVNKTESVALAIDLIVLDSL
jgi:hypothetical protein